MADEPLQKYISSQLDVDGDLTEDEKKKYPQATKTTSPATEKFVDLMAMGTPVDPQMLRAVADELTGNCTPGKEMPSHGLAYRQAKRLQTLIQERKRLAAQFHNVTPEDVIGATVMRAFASIDDAFDDDGNFDIQKARESGAIHLIKKLEKTRFGFKVEFYDAAAAQDKLGNYLGLERAPQQEAQDTTSLKSGIEVVAQTLAGEGNPITKAHLEEAWARVVEWANESKAKYTQDSMIAVAKEMGIDTTKKVGGHSTSE